MQDGLLTTPELAALLGRKNDVILTCLKRFDTYPRPLKTVGRKHLWSVDAGDQIKHWIAQTGYGSRFARPMERFEKYTECSTTQFYTHPDGRVTPCLIWTGDPTAQGYGYFWDGKKHTTAHRFIYLNKVGPAPTRDAKGKPMHLDHLCHNGTGCTLNNNCPHRACANFEHLEYVPMFVNVWERGSNPKAEAHRSDLCGKGLHPMIGNNVIIDTRGWRRCRECKNAYYRTPEMRAKRHVKTERRGRRLFATDVRSIRAAIAMGEARRNLAEQYGVDKSTIDKIATHKLWPNL